MVLNIVYLCYTLLYVLTFYKDVMHIYLRVFSFEQFNTINYKHMDNFLHAMCANKQDIKKKHLCTLDEKYRFSKTETLLKLYGNFELKFPVLFQQCQNYCKVSAGFRQVFLSAET